MDTTLLDLIICRIPGLKGNERVRLVEGFDKVEDFLLLDKKDIGSFLGRALKSRPWKTEELLLQAEEDSRVSRRLGIRHVSWREPLFPPLLREMHDPPALLFYRGSFPNPEKPMAAIVGTRKPSARAASRAFQLGRELGQAGISVVSGLALGIDSFAHRGNIDGGSPTVAVLGSSLDMIYPASNRDLASRILETRGLILSEYPPGTGPKAWTFPARNRIISALARGVVIVEAPEKSGALITARYALEQDRDLWVEREALASKSGAGTLRLAEEGAKVISSAKDILREWNLPLLEPGDRAEREAGEESVQEEENFGLKLAASLAEYLKIKV